MKRGWKSAPDFRSRWTRPTKAFGDPVLQEEVERHVGAAVSKCIAIAPPVVPRIHSVGGLQSLNLNKPEHKLLLFTCICYSVHWPHDNVLQHWARATQCDRLSRQKHNLEDRMGATKDRLLNIVSARTKVLWEFSLRNLGVQEHKRQHQCRVAAGSIRTFPKK